MAITILHSPLTDTASNEVAARPVNQRLIYHAQSDNYTETNFRFVVTVTSTVGGLSETFNIPASPSGEMYLDLYDLLSKKLIFEQNAESVHFENDFVREQHLGLISISIKEGYNVGGVFTVDDESIVTSEGIFIFWGAYDGATGPYPPISTFIMSATSGLSSRALSDRKTSTLTWEYAANYGLPQNECIFIPVRQRDYGVMHALVAAVSSVEKVLYSIVDATDTAHDEVLTLNGYRQEVIPCYPANLNGGTLVTNKPSDYAGWKYYTIQFALADETPVSVKYVFYPIEENCDHRNIRLAWRGHRGGYDYYNFQLKHTFTRDVTRNRFTRGYSGIDFSGQTRKTFERRPSVDRFIDISTNFVQDGEKQFLKWLFQSEEVRIIRDNGTSIPVLVDTNSFTYIEDADGQPLEQALVRLKYAGDDLDFNGWWVDEAENAELPDGEITNQAWYNVNMTESTGLVLTGPGLQLNSAYNLTVNWGDGSVETLSGGSSAVISLSHTYSTYGAYKIVITDNVASLVTCDRCYPDESRISLERIPITTTRINIRSAINMTTLPNVVPVLVEVTATDSAITQTEINRFLIDLDNAGAINGTVEVQGQTPAAPPSGAGITAKNNLIAKGWTVTTD